MSKATAKNVRETTKVGTEFEKCVAQLLQQLGADFVRGEAVGGVQPDFVVKAPNGKTAIVEVKGWDPSGGNTSRALNQVKQYQLATNADLALIVMPQLKRNFLDDKVVNEEGLLAILQEWLSKNWVRFRREPKREKPKKERIVFAAMPFDRKYDDTFFVAMTYAAEKVNAVCRRVDKEEFAGDIVEEIKRLILASVAVVVDLSESKENVLYEAGYAHALGKPTAHICSTDLSRLPFDVRNWNTILYDIGGTMSLRIKLARRLSSVI
jgi:hypothetical protein